MSESRPSYKYLKCADFRLIAFILSEREKTHNLLMVVMKMTSNGRRSQNVKSGISQKPHFVACTNLNLSLDDQTVFYKSLKLRQPSMKDDLKILIVEYLSNQLDHTL